MTSSGAFVLDEGRHYAVLDKAAGITVVRARGVPGKTLLDLAEERFGKGVRPVHRLDKPTTGCCVVAKTDFGQQALSDAFRRHLVDKRYLAVLGGTPPWSKLSIDARLLREDRPEARKGPLAVQTVDERGKRALTRVRVLARGEGLTLVEARPETGRMHQIRVHLAHVGFPLLGDTLYGGAGGEDLLLHAWAISFPSPDGGRRFVTAPIPPRMRERLTAAGIDVDKLVAAERERFVKKPEPKKPDVKKPDARKPDARKPATRKPRAKKADPRGGKPGPSGRSRPRR